MAIPSLALPESWEIDYPESDGRPVAETDVHYRELANAKDTLVDYFADRPDVYIAANLLVYFEEGDLTARIAPDVFLVRGVPRRERRTYKIWEEGPAPEVALEFTSKSTRYEDQHTKVDVYRRLGTREYFMFDPLEEYLKPPFQGWRLEGDVMQPIRMSTDGEMYSEVLGLFLRREGSRLRFIEPASGEVLPTPRERADAEAAARMTAEAERDRAEVERDKAEQERRRAEQERRRAEESRQRAEQERQRAEARTAELEAELARLKGAPAREG